MSDHSSVPELHCAAQAGDVEEIMRLVAAGADVNAQDENGNTALKCAAAEPFPRAIRKLLELGPAVNLADLRGFTPLHCAAAHGFYEEAMEMAEVLIEHGADVNAQSKELGFVPLHEATRASMIDLLLERGANPTVRSSDGLTPLEYMVEDERFDDAEHLRKRLQPGGRG